MVELINDYDMIPYVLMHPLMGELCSLLKKTIIKHTRIRICGHVGNDIRN